MKSRVPKVALPMLGQPVVSYPIEAARRAGVKRILVIVAKNSPLVDMIDGVEFVIQPKPLGTGDAVKVALRDIKRNELILILNGDNPLIRSRTIRRMYRRLKREKLSGILLTTELSDPTGYGRIIRDENGLIAAIIEEKNLKPLQRSIKEINAGVYIFRYQDLREALRRIRLNRKKKEYLLTDVILVMNRMGKRLASVKGSPEDALGINTPEEFQQVARIMKERIVRALRRRGVVLANPDTVEIEPSVRIGPGTTIGPYVSIRGETRIGAGTKIEPFVIIGDG